MKWLIAVTAVSLAACAPETVYKPVPVQTPVGVPCKIPSMPVPAFATTGISGEDTMLNQVRALATTNEQRKGYETRLAAAVKACQ